MPYLTIYNADHRAEIDDDLEGRYENQRDDIVTPDGDYEETPNMEDIASALEWLAAQDAGDSYPLRLDLDATSHEIAREIATTLENLRDSDEERLIDHITSDANMDRLHKAAASRYGGATPVRVHAAVLTAYEALEAAGGPPGALATLAALLAQKGCGHFDPACDDGLLTHLCDVVIFG